MSYKNCFSFLLLVITALCFGAREAYACSCAPTPTLLDTYEHSDHVVIMRVVSVEKAEAEKTAPEGQMSDGRNYVDGVKSTRMMIERVFKGSLKVGEEITFAQGGGADCVWTFSEKLIGEQFLFYLDTPKRKSALWVGHGCGRSGGLKYVGDDLLYLTKMDRMRGKSRLSGTIKGFYGNDEMSVERRQIRITGAGKTYKLETDKYGAYEIYDLPAGEYSVEPEIPRGWKLSEFFNRERSQDSPGGAAKKIPVTIEAKKHAEVDIHLEIDNAVRGKVYDPGGRVMKDVCIDLRPTQGAPKYFYKADCTDEEGKFEIEEIPAGSYLLVVNQRGEISSRQPFKMFYHPGVFERERATVITIGAGETLEGLDIRVPHAEETVTVEGFLLYSDGKPVEGESVEFKAAQTKDSVEGDARATTDAKGRFSIKILKGLEGELSAEILTYVGRFENCPKLDALIKKQSSDTLVSIGTDVVKIQAANDLKDVELRFPFPGCKKAKRPEDLK